MSLSDALKNGPVATAPRHAFPESIRKALPEEQYEALLALLELPDAWTADAISRLLKDGYLISVSPSTIRTWRRANLNPTEGV